MSEDQSNITAKPIECRAATIEGNRVIYLLHPWPELALMSVHLLEGALFDHVKPGDTAEDFTLTFENASAQYRKLSELEGVATMALQPGSAYSPPPEVIPPAPATEESVTDVGNLQADADPIPAYNGPAVHEVVNHDGEHKTVLATRASAAGSEVSFNKVDYFPVSSVEPVDQTE